MPCGLLPAACAYGTAGRGCAVLRCTSPTRPALPPAPWCQVCGWDGGSERCHVPRLPQGNGVAAAGLCLRLGEPARIAGEACLWKAGPLPAGQAPRLPSILPAPHNSTPALAPTHRGGTACCMPPLRQPACRSACAPSSRWAGSVGRHAWGLPRRAGRAQAGRKLCGLLLRPQACLPRHPHLLQGWESEERSGCDPYYEAFDVQWPSGQLYGGAEGEEGVPGREEWYLQNIAVGQSFDATRRGMATEGQGWDPFSPGYEEPNLYSDGERGAPALPWAAAERAEQHSPPAQPETAALSARCGAAVKPPSTAHLCRRPIPARRHGC